MIVWNFFEQIRHTFNLHATLSIETTELEGEEYEMIYIYVEQ
jgi:hypothetical protein